MDMLLLVLSLVLLTQLLGWLTASGLPTTVGWREGSNDGGDFRPKPLPVDVEHQVENGTSVTKTMYDDGFPSPLHRTAQFLYYIRYCIQTIWRVNNTSSGNAVLLLLLLAHRHTCPHCLCMSGFSCVSVITLCEMKMVKESGAAKKKERKGMCKHLGKGLTWHQGRAYTSQRAFAARSSSESVASRGPTIRVRMSLLANELSSSIFCQCIGSCRIMRSWCASIRIQFRSVPNSTFQQRIYKRKRNVEERAIHWWSSSSSVVI